MRKEIQVGAKIIGNVDGSITRREVIEEYHRQLELAKNYLPWDTTQTDIVERIANEFLDDITGGADGMEIADTEWWDKDEVINFINECLDSLNKHRKKQDEQLVLFDPAPYEKSLAEISLEEYIRLSELKKQTEMNKTVDTPQ